MGERFKQVYGGKIALIETCPEVCGMAVPPRPGRVRSQAVYADTRPVGQIKVAILDFQTGEGIVQ